MLVRASEGTLAGLMRGAELWLSSSFFNRE